MLGVACLLLLGACVTEAQEPPAAGVGGTPSAELAPSRNSFTLAVNRAQAFLQMRRFEEARAELEKAETIARKIVPTDFSLGTTYSYFGELYVKWGRLEDAAIYFQKAEKSFEVALGSDHLSVGVAFSRLGKVRILQRRSEEAIPLLIRAVEIIERSESASRIGKQGHQLVPRINTDLAHGYIELGQYDQAEQVISKTVAELSSSNPPDQLSLASANMVLADLRRKQERYPEAIEAAESALTVHERVFGTRSKVLYPMLVFLAGLYVKNHDTEKAGQYEARARALIEAAAN